MLTRALSVDTLASLVTDELVVAANGLISRELHAAADRREIFYMLGSMGLASSIGLGLALARPERRIVVLDGDGNLLMGLGNLPMIGERQPPNLTHLVLDNGTYASTGGQRSIADRVDLERLAASSGYVRAVRVTSRAQLRTSLSEALAADGPSLVLARISPHEGQAPPRVSHSPDRITETLLTAAQSMPDAGPENVDASTDAGIGQPAPRDGQAPFMIVGNRKIVSRASFPVINPFSSKEVGRAPIAQPGWIDKALGGAHAAPFEMAATARAALLRCAAGHYRERQSEAAWLITAESGIALRQARHEIDRVIEGLEVAAQVAERLDEEDLAAPYELGSRPGKARMSVEAEPVRLAVGITPFNHPANQVVHKVAPAIAAGACMVLKPSEKTPLSALFLAELLIDCGLPPHALNVVTGQPPGPVVEQLASYRGVELLSFTGSVEVGRKIARIMARSGNELVRYIPELGGNSALVVLDDAAIEPAARLALGAFDNAGQRCTAIKRILVQETVADEFVEALLNETAALRCGDPFDAETDIGPLIDEQAARLVESRVESALAAGARLLAGHNRAGALYPPTVLDRVTPGMDLVEIETFGPVAPVIRIGSLAEAIEIVRGGRYRLAGAIATASQDNARRYASAIRVGQFSRNGPPGYRTEAAPFGGFGDSGNGAKEGIVAATRSMRRLRTVYDHGDDA